MNTLYFRVTKNSLPGMNSISALLLIFCLISFETYAGHGAYIRVTNLTPYPATLSLQSTTGMNDAPALSSITLNAYNGTWPATAYNYIESDNLSMTSDFTLLATATNNYGSYNNGQLLSSAIQFKEGAMIYTQGSSTSNGLQFVTVLRPGGAGNNDSITLFIMLPSNRWMTFDPKIQKSTLQQITIPGAHDAGMYTTSSCTVGGNSCNAQTQVNSFINMLNLGVRYFDCRPVRFDTIHPLYLGHYNWFLTQNVGCLATPVQTVLNDVAAFLAGANTSNNPNKEVIWLDFTHYIDRASHDIDGSYFDQPAIDSLTNMVQRTIGQYLVPNTPSVLNIPIQTLTANGPKVFVTFDNSKTPTQTISQNGGNGIYSSNAYWMNKNPSETNSLSTMTQEQLGALPGFGPGTYNKIAWTLTMSKYDAATGIVCIGTQQPSQTSPTILYYADQANALLPTLLATCVQQQKFPNLLTLDGITNGTTAVPNPLLPLPINYQPIVITTLMNNQNSNIK